MVAIAASMAVVFVAGFAFRAWHLRAIERLSTDRRPLGSDGIVVGAEGFTLARARAPAVLLLHGAGDTPQTLRYLGEALFAQGFHVEAPLLPGHGRTLDAFRRTSAVDWLNAARSSYRALQSRATIGCRSPGCRWGVRWRSGWRRKCRSFPRSV